MNGDRHINGRDHGFFYYFCISICSLLCGLIGCEIIMNDIWVNRFTDKLPYTINWMQWRTCEGICKEKNISLKSVSTIPNEHYTECECDDGKRYKVSGLN